MGMLLSADPYTTPPTLVCFEVLAHFETGHYCRQVDSEVKIVCELSCPSPFAAFASHLRKRQLLHLKILSQFSV